MIRLNIPRLSLYSCNRFHSNWSQVRKHKAQVDLQKSRERTKLTTAIKKAVRCKTAQIFERDHSNSAKGADPLTNPWLHKCLEDAHRQEVPKSVIDAAIKKATSSHAGETILYEGRYKSIFFLIETQTDNRLRTAPQLKKIFKDYNGHYAEKGGEISWMFEKKGSVEFHAPLLDGDLKRLGGSLETLRSLVHESLHRKCSTGEIKELVEHHRDKLIDVLKPASIPIDSVFERALELDAEDVQMEEYLPQEILTKEQCPLAFSTQFDNGNYDWHSLFPRIEGAQILCPFEHLHALHFGMEEFRYFGHQPVILRSRHVWIPKTDTFDAETVWQHLPDDEEQREEILNLLDALKHHDDVVDVWHNLSLDELAKWE